jgi:hypothetical protein
VRDFAARRTLGFTESVIREMTRLCLFYRDPELGRQRVRFCFAKKMETLQRVEQLLGSIKKIQ